MSFKPVYERWQAFIFVISDGNVRTMLEICHTCLEVYQPGVKVGIIQGQFMRIVY